MFDGKNSKESFQYFMEYYAFKEEIREVLSLEMKKLFKDPYYQENEIRISHMTDIVCQEVGLVEPKGNKVDA